MNLESIRKTETLRFVAVSGLRLKLPPRASISRFWDRLLRLSLIAALLVQTSCLDSSFAGKNERKTQEYRGLEYKSQWSSREDSIVFMTFNVENLFDTQDDRGKSDETFLPAELKKTAAHKKKCAPLKNARWKEQCLVWDWSDKALAHKIAVLGKTIRQAKSGQGPDILVLQEVENRAVLDRLNKESGLNFPQVILIEGKDKRGIDVAVMTRMRVIGEPRLHTIPFRGFDSKKVGDTRGILQVDLSLPGEQVISVFGVHFPAPFHPVEMRRQAFAELNRLKSKLPEGRLTLAAGDFNVPKREDEKLDIVNQSLGKTWVVGHKVACQTCPGSTYYPPKDSWSFLDMILWSSGQHKKGGWQPNPKSMRVLKAVPEQVAPSGAPARFNAVRLTGVSDHWPLAIDLEKQSQ